LVRSPIALVAFDLDGTLLRGDTVCQAIARQMGHLDRMNEFEQRSHTDEIAAARSELAGYYASSSRDQLLSYLECCQLAPGTESAFALLKQHGIQTAIVSIRRGVLQAKSCSSTSAWQVWTAALLMLRTPAARWTNHHVVRRVVADDRKVLAHDVQRRFIAGLAVRPYRPANCGLRFSMNARRPSM